MPKDGYDFAGFSGFYSPRYTPIPDQLLDEVMAFLTGAELKVLLYIMRHTYGYKKSADSISIKQMTEGIVGADRRVIDHGTGLGQASVRRAVATLEEKNLITVDRQKTAAGDSAINVYRVRQAEGGTPKMIPPPSQNDTTVGSKRDPQETNRQETTLQENDNESLSFILQISERYGRNAKDRQALATSLSKWPLEVVREAAADLEKRVADGGEVRNPGAYLNSLLPIFGELQEQEQVERSKAQRERLVTIASAAAFHRQAGDDEQTIEERLREDFPGEEELIAKVLSRGT